MRVRGEGRKGERERERRNETDCDDAAHEREDQRYNQEVLQRLCVIM